MTLNADIRLDFNHMMSDSVGENGILRADVDGLKSQLSQIHQGLTDLRKLGQLPFLDLPYQDDSVKRLRERAAELRGRFRHAVVLGIGGSALGARLLLRSLAGDGGMTVSVCDTLDPEAWARLGKNIKPEESLIVAVSKSGKTLETWAALIYFIEKFKAVLGEKVWSHLVVVTGSREGPLRRLAGEKNVASFEIPSGVGGRYSVLSPVGLLPAALAGVDLELLLSGAKRMEDRCRTEDPWMNPALMSAALHYLFETKKGRNLRILLSYGEGLKGYAPWFAQLWAESLGKRSSGSTPVSSTGPQDQHSQLQLYLDGPEDKVITLLGLEEDSREIHLPALPDWAGVLEADGSLLEKRGIHEMTTASRLATEEALRVSERPNQTLLLKRLDAFSVGQLIALAELETVYAGQLLNVNPFDQPAVEQIKKNVREFLTGRITPSKSRNYMI